MTLNTPHRIGQELISVLTLFLSGPRFEPRKFRSIGIIEVTIWTTADRELLLRTDPRWNRLGMNFCIDSLLIGMLRLDRSCWDLRQQKLTLLIERVLMKRFFDFFVRACIFFSIICTMDNMRGTRITIIRYTRNIQFFDHHKSSFYGQNTWYPEIVRSPSLIRWVSKIH